MSAIEFDWGICTDSAHDDDGHPELGLDFDGPVGDASGAKTAHIHPFGFDSRPLDAAASSGDNPQVGCSALVARDGDRISMMPLDDPRVVAKLPKQRKGGSRQYCADGNYAAFEGDDPKHAVRAGSYICSVKYEAGDGSTKAHILRLEKRKKGAEQLSLLHGEGHGFVCGATGNKPASIRNVKGDAGFTTDDKGNTITGKTKCIGAFTVGEPGAAMPVVLLEPLIGYLTALEGALRGAPGGPVIVAPASSIAAALGAKFLKAL